jgi:hypothetical protein
MPKVLQATASKTNKTLRMHIAMLAFLIHGSKTNTAESYTLFAAHAVLKNLASNLPNIKANAFTNVS